MKRKVGDLEWRQVSMWDFPPRDSIIKYKKSECGNHTFQYYLIKTTNVFSDDHWKTEVVTSLEGIDNSLFQDDCSYYLSINNKTTRINVEDINNAS